MSIICKGPMSPSFLSNLISLDQGTVDKILNEMHEAGIIKKIEKEGCKVYIPDYWLETEEFDELENLSKEAAEELFKTFDETLEKWADKLKESFEKRQGEYSLSAIVGHVILKSIYYFLEKFKEELLEEAEAVAEQLSKSR